MKHFVILLVIFCARISAFSQDYTPVHHLLDSSAVFQKHFVGFALYDMSEGRYVVTKNERQHFTPASNSKIFALFSALEHLADSIPGIAYEVSGDSLFFWGVGDPTFLHPKLCSGRVMEFLQSSPYKLFYVPQPVKQPFYRNGWTIEDYQYAYQPELSIFPIYGNVVRFFRSKNALQTTPSYFERFIFKKDIDETFAVVRRLEENRFEVPRRPAPAKFSAVKPFKYSDELFVALLVDTLKRAVEVVDRPLPKDVSICYSQSTREVLREMMVYSDNFFAEQLAYASSFVTHQDFDTKRLRDSLTQRYYRHFSDSVSLHDESGLSFYNKVTPTAMVELLLLLDSTINDPALRNYYFPAGGIDGTLKNTYTLSDGMPFVWAKTGTVHAVYNQSGFVRGRSGKEYAFSFLNNNFLGNLSDVRAELANVITYVYLNY